MNAALRGVAAFVRRDWAIALSYRVPFALDGLAVALQLVIAYFIGRSVTPGASAPAALDDGYFAFAAIGVATLGVLQVGLIAFGARLRQEQASGTLELLLAAPLPAHVVLLAGGMYELAREGVVAVLTVLVAVLVLGLDLDTGPGRLAVAVVAFGAVLVVVAAVGILVCAFGLVFKQAAAAAAAASGVLAAFSGVWFPVSGLPEPLETLAGLLPTTWALDVLRAALLGGDVPEDRLAGVLAAAAVAVPLAMVLLSGALRRARRDGSIGQY
jgi:ABC-2 type transport system permease protein